MKTQPQAKTRDPIARVLRTPAFRTRTVADKRRNEGRKAKHKQKGL